MIATAGLLQLDINSIKYHRTMVDARMLQQQHQRGDHSPAARPLTAPAPINSYNKNNVTTTNSPVRKELGPSSRPALPRQGETSLQGGLAHSRSGASLPRGSYDGKIAGLYDLEETLGRGHFAVVKLARHVFTGEKVAVKVIDKTKLDEVSRAHLFQEVRCMKLVQHPHVVRLYEVIDTQTKLYLILELADGGDLYDYIMRHEEGLVEDQARTYFRQIVHAISYCHKLHVVHRDLKPENVVFFERLGVVKLTDFGFSNRFDPGQKLETSCGSLAYSAPEILLGDSYDAPAVDVWSLGVILYMLVCGHAPFQEANDSETLTMIMDCKYQVPSYVSPACARLIGRMLVRAPERRATLEELASDPWLKLGESISPAGGDAVELAPLVSRETVSEEDHNHILLKMVAGKIATKEEILEALDKNEYNHITATYFLLAERKLRAQRLQDPQQRSSSGATTKAVPTPSPLLLSPGSPGDLLLSDSSGLSSVLTPPRPLSGTSSTLLSLPPDTPQTQQQGARGRKCSIVTEEEDDEGDTCDSGRGDTCHNDVITGRCMLSRRGSRSEGKLSVALQQRLATAKPPPVRTTPQIISSATIPLKVQQPTPLVQTSPYKTLPTPLHPVNSSPQITLNEIFEEIDSSKTPPTVIPRVVVTRQQKFHKNRTASCSSSDDEDNESRKKRVHKLKTLPSNTKRKDSYEDDQGGEGGGGQGHGHRETTPHYESTSSSTHENKQQQQQQQNGSSNNNNNGRRHTGYRRRCVGTAGETRLRESQSLNRITEVQESTETLSVSTNVEPATSPRSKRSLGARFLLLVGKKPSNSSETTTKEEKENCSNKTTKITRYFHLHRKLCLPMFKANNNNNNDSTSVAANSNNGGAVWLGATAKNS